MKFLWFIVLLIVIPNFSFSQNHIDTIKNNTVSFRFGLPFHTSKNFSEIDIYKYNQSFNVYYQRVLLRPGSFLIKTEFGLGTVGDACESRFCPVVDLSLNTDYGIKKHFIHFGLGNNFSMFTDITGYYKLGYSFFFAKHAFLTILFEQLLWNFEKEYSLPPTNDCEECYETKYNIWAWDLDYYVFEVNFGFGFKF